jgi:hypothetical protein
MAEIIVWVPYPYSKRSAYLNICAMPAEDEDAVLICIKSNKQQSGQEWLNGKTVTKDTSCVEADVNATVYIQMVSENK